MACRRTPESAESLALVRRRLRPLSAKFLTIKIGIMAVDEHCPVLDLFRNPVPVTRDIVTAR
jgi:hypothetical protein